jgi:four helix bundle protein
MITDPTFEEWEARIADSRTSDPLWRMAAYRLASYVLEIGWADAKALDRVHMTRSMATQLYRALGSIVANLAEGYSRGSGPDRVRHFEYALGSARESRGWYMAAAPVLDAALVASRVRLLDRICQLLLVAIPRERKRQIRGRT